MIETLDLPAVNATLNSTASVLITAGWVAIKKKRVELHKKLMLAAVAVSALFLASYLTHHYLHGSKKFAGTGVARTVYLAILGSHTILAMAVVPLVMVTVWRGLTGQDARHAAIARWTMPIWLYVSVTGVTVYWMLYRIWGPM